MTDPHIQLIKACIKKDKQAQSKLYELCFGYLYPVCLRYATCEDDAKEYLNLGFYKILKNLKKLHKRESFLPWSKRVMINSILDELKKKKRYQNHVQLSDIAQLETASGTIQFDENLGAQEIYLAIRSLPPQTASVFNLHAIDGYKHKEIAQMLGISEGTVKWHYSDARKRLQKLLAKKGYPEKMAS